MVTSEHSAIDHSAVTARFRHSVEAQDVGAVLETLAPDVVLYSPITERVIFNGRDQVRDLLRSVFVTIEDIRYFADVGEGGTRALFYRANVNGQRVEEATRVELDDLGQIKEITLFFRPLPGITALAAALGPRMASSHGPVRSMIARLLLSPLALLTRLGDRLTTWLV